MTDQPTPAETKAREAVHDAIVEVVNHPVDDAEWDNCTAALTRALTLARTQGAVEMNKRVRARSAQMTLWQALGQLEAEAQAAYDTAVAAVREHG